MFDEYIVDVTSGKHYYVRLIIEDIEELTQDNTGHIELEYERPVQGYPSLDQSGSISFDITNTNGNMPCFALYINTNTTSVSPPYIKWNFGYNLCGVTYTTEDVTTDNFLTNIIAGYGPINNPGSNIMCARVSDNVNSTYGGLQFTLKVKANFPIFLYEDNYDIVNVENFGTYYKSNNLTLDYDAVRQVAVDGDYTNLNKAINYYTPITVWHTVNDVVIRAAWEVTDRALEGSDDIRTTEEGDIRQTEIEL